MAAIVSIDAPIPMPTQPATAPMPFGIHAIAAIGEPKGPMADVPAVIDTIADHGMARVQKCEM